MKKTLFISLIYILNIFAASAQEKTISIKLKDKKRVLYNYYNQFGDLLIHTAKQPSSMLNLFKNNELRFYDKDLNLKFSKEINQSKNIISRKFAYSGKYLINHKEIINKNGESKEYPFEGYDKVFAKKSNLNPIFSFFNGYAYTIIGPKKGRKNKKKIYEGDDIKIFNLRNSDLKEESFTLKPPKIETNREIAEWYLGENFENSFFLTSTDVVEKNTHTAVNHFANHDYDGSLKKYTKISINLDKDKYFLFSHNNGPVYHPFSAYGGHLSYSGVDIDVDKKTFLLYGYYSKSDGKQQRVGKVDGIYAFKFDNDGNQLWKNYYPFSTTKKGYLIKRKIEYNECNGKGVIHSYIDDQNLFFTINSENGSLETSSNELLDVFKKSKILKEDNFLYLNMYVGGYFRRQFKDKKMNNNTMNYNILKAMLLKPEIKQFILNRTSSIKKAFYDANINKTGEIIIEEKLNRNTELNLYKF